MRIRLITLAVTVAACTPTRPSAPTPTPTPQPGAETAAPTPAPLPEIPAATGPLQIRVVYPPANHLIQSRDSTFIFGSTGNGTASLTVNGTPVKVHPNGAWLAFLPIPPQSAPRWDIVATTATETARLAHPVRLLPPPVELPLDGPLVADTSSFVPAPGLMLRDEERVRVAIRAPENASVWATFAGGLQMLTNLAAPDRWLTEIEAEDLRRGGTLFVARGRDTLRFAIPPVAAIPAQDFVRLGEALVASDTDRTIVGRPAPAGTYKWYFSPGTIVRLTGRQGAFARVRLDRDLEVWVDSVDVLPLVSPAHRPLGDGRRTAGNIRVVPAAEWSDVRLALPLRVPYLVEETPDGFRLTLYNTVANTDQVNYLAVRDPVVRRIDWRQETEERAVYDIRTVDAPYGYLAFHDGTALVLRLRRTPRIDPERPLRGLTIVVDPGHPPGGATGPTGLWEPQAVLAVGQALQRILTERGANVVMTRTTMDPVALGDRPILARRANGHALVSLHLDAVGDASNPFVAQGTGTYFYRMHSEPLARAVQAGMYRQMGLRDRGVYSANFAVVRTTWMPAVLAEGGFLMIPEQENAFRTPAFQERYARGVADGMEAYFRGLVGAK